MRKLPVPLPVSAPVQVFAIAMALGTGSAANAQRTEENAVTAAQDAFGVSVGNERIGLYNDREVRGFSPVTAGNVRVEGIYMDLQGSLNNSLTEGNTIRVGLSALSYPFPAPTGIVDFQLRDGDGEAMISPTLRLASFGTVMVELEGFVPVSGDALTLSGAVSLRRNAQGPGNVNRIFNYGIVPRWQPTAGVQIVPFYGYSHNREDIQPTVFTSGSYLPPDPKDEAYGQRWADQNRIQSNMGVLMRFDLADNLTLRGGAFRSRWNLLENYADLYRNTTREGFADHVINASPEQVRLSTSGEVRLTWQKTTGKFSHTVHLMSRARKGSSRYGGSTSAQLGRAEVGVARDVDQPQYAFGAQSLDDVRQLTGGVGYEGIWSGVGQISLGLQKSRYEKTVDGPALAPVTVETSPWLYNASGAVYLTRRLAIYGGVTRGLEENGTAPDAAANRGEPLPSAITSQRELGFRYSLNSSFQVVGGVFDLRKPYFSLDAGNVFTELGSLSTRGAELSLAGPVLPGLNVVAGVALMDPRVTGEAVALGRVGAKAVAQTRRLVRINADYRFPFAPSFSVDAELEHSGPVTASVRPDPLTGVQFEVPSKTTFDLGARYRFNLADAPAILRLSLMNITGVRGWDPTSSGGFQREDPRRIELQLAADF